ncbi:hypothetical protein PCO31111_05034 [Pandoraea communis]|uniref:Uncharacterized protein n=1 Tax=Pandoraea communis TaxID=2508297 RepID=A0A5E4Z576_9BURK|nr:hypothetical protein [Pandoraea communis]VVE55333.1 hypothetical protein PCO31111_05034 [Pandoraea communis]
MLKSSVAVLLTLAIPFGAHAMPVFKVTADETVVCTTAADLHIATRSPEKALPTSCRKVQSGFAFEALNRTAAYDWPDDITKTDLLIYGRELAGANESGAPRYLNVLRSDVSPVLDEKGALVEAKCDYPHTFVTNSLRAAPDGKLYLKQGKVTIKCVNGEMRQIYQPLN